MRTVWSKNGAKHMIYSVLGNVPLEAQQAHGYRQPQRKIAWANVSHHGGQKGVASSERALMSGSQNGDR